MWLTEGMTGTPLYAEISRQAHRRYTAEQGALRALGLQAGGHVPLASGERSQLEAELGAAEDLKAERARARERAQADLAWHEQRAAHRLALGRADQAVTDQQAALAARAEDLALLAAVEHAEQGRADLEASDAAKSRTRAAEATLAAAAEALQAQALGWRSAVEARGEALLREHEVVREQRDTATAWLEDHPAVAPRVEAWALWKRQLQELAEAQDARRDLDEARPALVRTQERAVAALEALVSGAPALHQAVVAAEQGVAALQAGAPPDLEALGAQVSRAQADREALLALVEQAQGLEEREARLAAQRESELRLRTALETAERARQQAALAHARRQGARQQAHADLARRQAEAAVAEHRALLEPGAPCPLCGATEHPWGDHPSDGEVLAAHQARLSEAQAAEDTAAAALGEAAARQEACRTSLSEVGRHAAEAQEALTTARATWRAAAEAQGVEDPTPDRLGARAASLGLALGGLRDTLARAAAHARQLRDAHARVGVARQARVDHTAAHHRASEQLATTVRDLARNREESGRLADRRQALHLRLQPVLGEDWLRRHAADPAALLRQADAEVTRWREEHARQGQAADRLAVLQAQERQAHEELARASQAVVEASLAGRAEPRPAAGSSADSVNRAVGEREAAARACQQEQAVWRTARAGLAAVLTELGLDEPGLRARLVRGAAWTRDQRATFDGLQLALDKARAVVEATRDRLERHEHSDPPEQDEPTARAQVAATEAAFTAAAEQAGALSERLRADDEMRRAHTDLLQQLEAQQAVVDHWKALDALIGSSDGRVFRRFAQSLTLELLLAWANGHLRELAPRYQLIRAEGTDLGLQVIDRDMGDELRSVASLSGGECFLTSLALALALSSLSTRDTRVETLFIDEGLGTLDAETLEVALHTLDQLQASGRQIGLISHVPALAARIGVQVAVRPVGGGLSRVEVQGVGG